MTLFLYHMVATSPSTAFGISDDSWRLLAIRRMAVLATRMTKHSIRRLAFLTSKLMILSCGIVWGVWTNSSTHRVMPTRLFLWKPLIMFAVPCKTWLDSKLKRRNEGFCESKKKEEKHNADKRGMKLSRCWGEMMPRNHLRQSKNQQQPHSDMNGSKHNTTNSHFIPRLGLLQRPKLHLRGREMQVLRSFKLSHGMFYLICTMIERQTKVTTRSGRK
mmetsp:Transcript_9344/g.19399  ORF Transcript_9344/g.19399 Transcript_9344/m.19399 type:complete len:217 (+) Transcript_9344:359-1009(+)